MSFFESLRSGDPKGVAVAMIQAEKWPANPNPAVDLNGGMSMAAMGGYLHLVQQLHDTMKDRGIKIISYNWALDRAALAGSKTTVDWLLEEMEKDGVQVDEVLPMWMAAFNGHLELVKKFYAMCAACRDEERRMRAVNSALNQAAWMGRLPVILFLIFECRASEWGPALRLLEGDTEVLRKLWDFNSNLFQHHKLIRPKAL